MSLEDYTDWQLALLDEIIALWPSTDVSLQIMIAKKV